MTTGVQLLNMRTVNPADSFTTGVNEGTLKKCRIHGLFFDTTITSVCPICERERTERVEEHL